MTHGLAKQRPELPTAKDVLGLVKVIYGEPMFRAWTAIVYPHAHAHDNGVKAIGQRPLAN
ncbi:hypothetical protein MASR1M50_01160 [Burkholderiales bacterium]